MDYLPPPPYSETDELSSAGIRTPTTSTTSSCLHHHHRSVSNTSSNLLQTNDGDIDSSLTSSIVYTPPGTPDGSVHPSETTESDTISQSSLEAYFDSRPIISTTYETLLVHEISVPPTSQLADLPFPQPENLWLLRDLMRQDWATFVNYLIPNHTNTSNTQVSDRKTKADLIDGRMYRLTIQDDDHSKPNAGELDARLISLPNYTPKPTGTDESAMKRHIEKMVDDWNVRFFGPRGLQIRNLAMAPPLPTTRPIPIFPVHSRPESSNQRGLLRGMYSDSSSSRDNENIGNGMSSNERSFMLGGPNGIVFSANGFSMGGPRGIVADQNGFRMGNRDNSFNESRHSRPAHHRHERSHGSHGRGRGRGRGRPPGRYPNHQRSSSASSTSSNSSSSSEESVGSLVDYDKVPDVSLPRAKSLLIEWLNHPDQPITKDSIRKFNSTFNRTLSQPTEDLRSLKEYRKEIKALMKQFKGLKKAQKRERRTAKRAEKRRAKAARREERRTRKAEKRGKGRAMYDDSSSSDEEDEDLAGMSEINRISVVSDVPVASHNPAQRTQTGTNVILADANRMQAEVNRIIDSVNRMQGDINQMKILANMPDIIETGRQRFREVVERLEDAQKMLMEEKGRLEEDIRRLMNGEAAPVVGEQENGVVNMLMTQP